MFVQVHNNLPVLDVKKLHEGEDLEISVFNYFSGRIENNEIDKHMY